VTGPANSGEPGLEGESTTVLRPGSSSGNDEPTQTVSGEEPTAQVDQPDEDGQRTQVIRPGQNNQNDQPTERWH
jgi:hypothetical protein